MALQVRELLEQVGLELKCLTDEADLSRQIENSRIQKPGLLLTGLLKEEIVHSDRVQIFGAGEIRYLESIDKEKQAETLAIFESTLPVIIITRNLAPPDSLLDFARKTRVPLLVTPHTSSILIDGVLRFLEEGLAQTVLMHGVLVDLLGIGVLIQGESGIGKSECALELLSRGYRLVADDAVFVKRIYPGILFGSGSDKLPYHLEVRGVGIVNVKDLFGITAIRKKKQMDLLVELEHWDPKGEYDRLGFDVNKCEILGVELPCTKVPVSPGRSIAAIVEAAARKQLLRIMGFDMTRQILENLPTMGRRSTDRIKE